MEAIAGALAMDTVTLKPGCLVARERGEESVVRPESTVDLLPYFFHQVELDPQLTLGDLFELVDTQHVELLAGILCERILPILEEARGGSQPKAREEVEYLRVYNDFGNGVLFRGFDGWGRWQDGERETRGGIAVELSPIRELLHLPLRYEPEVEFHDERGAVEYRTRIGITLLELLKAVFWELTYFGTPTQRDAYMTNLVGRAERADRGEKIPLAEILADVETRRD